MSNAPHAINIRGDKKFVVNSKSTLEKNDIVYFVVDNDNFLDAMKSFGHDETESQKIVIIGGGNIGYSLAKKIEEEDKNISTNLIEFKKSLSSNISTCLAPILVFKYPYNVS